MKRLTAEEVAAPSDDPREFAAVRHNLEQARREIERERRLHEEDVAAVRNEFENSLSWKITRPASGSGSVPRLMRSCSRLCRPLSIAI